MKPTHNRVVLHVDDDPQMTDLVTKQLTKVGYDVVSINDPAKVISMLIQNDCRVVMLDIDMPHINGLELLEEIKQFDGGIQVIMITGIVTTANVLRSFRLGAEACFFKPIDDFQPIVDALEDAFGKIDRWRHTLEELVQRKQVENGPTQTAVANK